MRLPLLLHRRLFVESRRQIGIGRAIEQAGTSKDVTVNGWVDSVRKISRKMSFVHMYDGLTSDKLQVILAHPIDPAVIKGVSLGACITVSGQMQAAQANEANGVELVADNVKVHANTKDDHPFYRRKMVDYEDGQLRRYPHLRAVEPRFANIVRARHTAMRAVHDFFDNRDYVHIQTPIVTSNDCEGGSEVFVVESDAINSASKNNEERTNYFDTKAYLTVSGQLHLEAMTCGIAKTYTLSPAFRAESNDTKQHLAEFYMIEAELAFANDIETLMETVEGLIIHTASALDNANYSSKSTVTPILDGKYERITHDDAVRDLLASGVEFKRTPANDMRLHKEHEWALLAANNNRPIFVTHHNADASAFYMARDGDHSLSFDLLMPRCAEVAGGSMRENDYDKLTERLGRLPENTREKLQWYVDLRKYGYGNMGGFGVGFDRLLQVLLDVPNVRDTLPFPRITHSCPM